MEALDDCPDDSDDESMAIAQLLLRQQCYRINDGAFAAFADSIRRRRMFSLFANAGSIRHGIDRMRRLQANCLLSRMGEPMRRDDLITIDAEDILSSRVSHAAPCGHALTELNPWGLPDRGGSGPTGRRGLCSGQEDSG